MKKTHIQLGISRSLAAWFGLTLVAGCTMWQSKEVKPVLDQRNLDIRTAGDRSGFLADRLHAIQDLSAAGDRTLIPDLKRLLARSQPAAERQPVNWDPQAAERVVDLHLIVALHVLGDDSEVGRVAGLVRQAGDILMGPDEELKNQVFAILTLGRLDVLTSIVEIAAENDLNAKRNAVRLLDSLNLPMPPVDGGLTTVPHMRDTISFTIQRLSEELRVVEERSAGSIVLSPGVREYATLHDYERGTVRRENVPLSEIVLNDLRLLDFNYFVESSHVVICTHTEAASRWLGWWSQYRGELEYRKEQKAFVLKGRHQT